MILFFECGSKKIIAAGCAARPENTDIEKLIWLFGNATLLDTEEIEGLFTGPRKEMITPWSTNAVEITQNMGITGIFRIEEFNRESSKKPHFDPMLQALYKSLDQHIFTIDKKP